MRLPVPLPLLRTTLRARAATTLAAAALPRVAPFEGRPFEAAPEDSTKGQLGQVSFPDMSTLEKWEPQALLIPSEPDNYTTSRQREDKFPAFHEPNIITAAALSTHLGGGPSHGSGADDVQLGEAGDSMSSLPASQDVSSAVEDVRKTIEHEGGRLAAEIEEATGIRFGGLGSGIEGKGGAEEYKFEDRELDAEEKRGLIVLGGIVVGGLVLGGLTRPRKQRVVVRQL